METNTERLNRDLQTAGETALHAYLHPAYFGLVVYDRGRECITEITTSIHDTPLHSPSAGRTDGIDLNVLQDWLDENSDVINGVYHTVRICVSTPVFQLINDEGLATPGILGILNEFDVARTELWVDRIRDDLFVQYGLDKDLCELLESHFERECIHFGEMGLLQLLSAESDLLPDGIYCQLLGHEAAVTVISGSRLVFFNKYLIRDREDLLYYILLCFQSHGMDPHDDHLYLSGLIEKDSPMYQLLYDYVKHIEFMEMPGGIPWPEDRAGDFSGHYFISLLSIR